MVKLNIDIKEFKDMIIARSEEINFNEQKTINVPQIAKEFEEQEIGL